MTIKTTTEQAHDRVEALKAQMSARVESGDVTPDHLAQMLAFLVDAQAQEIAALRREVADLRRVIGISPGTRTDHRNFTFGKGG